VPSQNPFSETDRIADNALQLADELACRVAASLASAIKLRGDATLIVSGGSTPKPFLEALARQNLQWSRLNVSLADERWVEPHDIDSNERFVRDNLLVGAAESATFISLKNPATSPDKGWELCDAGVATLRRPFDVVVLGMGGDGHTASLFAGDPASSEALTAGCGKLTWPTQPPDAAHARISLTLDAIVDARQLLLHIVGEEKRAVYRNALNEARATGPLTYPVSAIIRAAPDRLQVYWSP